MASACLFRQVSSFEEVLQPSYAQPWQQTIYASNHAVLWLAPYLEPAAASALLPSWDSSSGGRLTDALKRQIFTTLWPANAFANAASKAPRLEAFDNRIGLDVALLTADE